LHGGIAAMQMAESCIGYSQAQVCALAYADSQRFIMQYDKPYQLTQHGEIVLLIAPNIGLKLNPSKISEIQLLKSVKSININAEKGLIQSRIVGLITLCHNNLSVINDDLNRIREIEQNGFYQTIHALNSLNAREEVDQSCL